VRDARLVLEVGPDEREAATAFLRDVPAVTGTMSLEHEVVVEVHAPYEGQLSSVVENVRRAPGLRSLRVSILR
jgi:hypothetical protein